MFDFIVARDPDTDRIDDSDENILSCRAFKWFINHNGAMGPNTLMTVDIYESVELFIAKFFYYICLSNLTSSK